MAEQAVEEYVQFEPGRPVAGVFYERSALAGLRLDELVAQQLAEAAAAIARVGGSGGLDDPGQHLRFELQRTQTTTRAELLRGQVRKAIRELLVADRGADAVAKTLRQPLTADIDISRASRAQLAEIQRVMIPIQHKLATTVMRKRRSRTDLIDVRATLRASMATGGVPVKVVHRKPRPTKPHLYVLADMSGSVANFAAFTVSLVSAMSQLFSRLRTFAFIEHAAEVTDAFRQVRGPEHAIAAMRDYVTAGELGRLYRLRPRAAAVPRRGRPGAGAPRHGPHLRGRPGQLPPGGGGHAGQDRPPGRLGVLAEPRTARAVEHRGLHDERLRAALHRRRHLPDPERPARLHRAARLSQPRDRRPSHPSPGVAPALPG